MNYHTPMELNLLSKLFAWVKSVQAIAMHHRDTPGAMRAANLQPVIYNRMIGLSPEVGRYTDR